MKDNRTDFCELLRSTNREGVDYVIEELDELGFFTAPASAAHHLNIEGGLVEHSMNVCKTALAIREVMVGMDDSLREALPRESVIIAALLHDVCKADIYRPSLKKRKNSFGMWESVPGYNVEYDNSPLGHGEKSVIMLLRWGLDMTDDEIMAIRWHMHAWDLPFQSPDAKGNYNAAKEQSPLITLIQAADGLSAGILESDYTKD